MTSQAASGDRANLLGSAWMTLSMAAFAVEDSFVKTVSQTLPVSQILLLFGLGGALVFAGLMLARGERLYVPEVLSRPMIVRMLFEIMGRLFFVLAISLASLSSATVIMQATPLVVVAGAALVFGERVGWRRWTAVGLGLLGVVIIVQPGAESFSLFSSLAILGMLGSAGRDLATRAAPASVSTSILGLYGFLAVMVAGALLSLWEAAPFVRPTGAAWLLIAAAVLAGVTAYACIMKAMRMGDVSAVTPFRYTRLIFGVGLGVVVFGEAVSLSMLVGSGLIVLSGLFIFWRGKQVASEG
jgi:drug/metabolite transporter (DMT)-like permease